MYENFVKAQRVAKLKREFKGLVAEEIVFSGKPGLRQEARDNRGRRVDMLKVEVGTFIRGDTDEVLNSFANFNITVKACGMEAVSYSERTGTEEEEEEEDLATLLGRFVSKDFQVVASMRAEFGEQGGRGSKMMKHLCDNFVDLLVYESTDPEVHLQRVDWDEVMRGGGTEIKKDLDKVWAMTKLRGDTEKLFGQKSRQSKTPLETSRFSRKKKQNGEGGLPPFATLSAART